VSDDSVLLRIFLPFSYAGIGGSLGGMTVLFAKSAAELITTTIGGDNQFIYFPTYLIFLGILVTGIGQVYYINQGLKKYDALLQVPCFYVVYTLCGIISGGIYFNDFQSFSQLQFFMFFVGVSLTFVGVIFLGGRLSLSEGSQEEILTFQVAPAPEESIDHAEPAIQKGMTDSADDPRSPPIISPAGSSSETPVHGKVSFPVVTKHIRQGSNTNPKENVDMPNMVQENDQPQSPASTEHRSSADPIFTPSKD
jgi:hypothetical protein